MAKVQNFRATGACRGMVQFDRSNRFGRCFDPFVEALMGCRSAESSARRKRSLLMRFSSIEQKILLAIGRDLAGENHWRRRQALLQQRADRRRSVRSLSVFQRVSYLA